ncbi:beta-lactamase family protein [Microbacterium sp. HD4P20]|uniref:serine hydrolase domain-containing protein n=1 Tax=Microbacterium sp. HD4P20 TaxID=2864874 RepID=UPI001C63FD71|nr:serine hydrolase domain-containing protein [Microbacterium sp. HD4P20]MCP2635390.1 beta-lactamase family protein [Microbacterium sp. HD4P20]
MRTHTLTSGMRLGALALALAAAMAVTGCSGAAPAATPAPTATGAAPDFPADTAAALQAALDDTRGDEFAGVIARVITPEGTWTGTSGTAAPDGETAPSPDDRTRIGSLTKTMTATILLQLVEEGLVSLDDPISQYVPDSPNGAATLRQLADMTSGIPSYSLDPDWQDKYFGDPFLLFAPQELVDAAKTLPVDGAPGEVWKYSNTNYVLLGMVIEQVLEQPIAEVFAERLFEPLSMVDTVYPGSSAGIDQPHLVGLTNQRNPGGPAEDATEWSPSFASTAGEVVSTLDDLTLWAHALFTGEGVLDDETQQLRRDSILSSPAPNDAESGYGIGWGERADGWWGHSGTIPGFTTSVFHSYDENATIVVVANTDAPLASGEVPAPAVFEALAAALG